MNSGLKSQKSVNLKFEAIDQFIWNAKVSNAYFSVAILNLTNAYFSVVLLHMLTLALLIDQTFHEDEPS